LEILVFDFGGTQGRCGLASRDGKLSRVLRLQRSNGEEGGTWFERLLAAGRGIVSQQTRTVAVSFGGPVATDGRILSMHVAGWEKVDLRGELSRAFRLPIVVENDANCGALGEFHFGAGRGKRTIAYMTVSTGIGGGVILDGKLYRGAHGMAAEFGHMVLHPGPNAPQYAAGKPGVLEALSSGPAIARDARAKLAELKLPVPEKLTAKDVFDAAGRSENWACDVLGDAIGHLGRGVAAAICAYDVERVVIGGGVAQAGKLLFEPLREKVAAYIPHYLAEKYDIVPAELGDDAPMLGAVALVADV